MSSMEKSPRPTVMQHVTPYLGKNSRLPVNFSDSENIQLIVDTEEGLKLFRKLIFKKIESDHVVLVVYNKSTISTIDLYFDAKLSPKFDLIIQSPMVLYNKIKIIHYEEDGVEKFSQEVATKYDYRITNNKIFHYEKTPCPEDVYAQAELIIRNVGSLFEGNIIVIGSRKQDPDNGIYYINDLAEKPNSSVLVIDTMLTINDEYVNFSESIERFYSFNNVIYYRLMSKTNFKKLILSRDMYHQKIILEAINYGYNPSELNFNKINLDVLDYYLKSLNLRDKIDTLLDYPLDIIPGAFLIKWIEKGYNLYQGALMAILLNNKSFITNLINFPDKTEDPGFNYVNQKRVRDSVIGRFGKGEILPYLNIFNEFHKHGGKSSWCDKFYINYFTIYNISKELGKFGVSFEEFEVISTHNKLKDTLKEIYGNNILKEKNGSYYDSNSNSYRIDTSYTIQSLSVIPKCITPLIVERIKSEINVVYLYI